MQGIKIKKKVRIWMAYTVPHFRYGALMYNKLLIDEKTNENKIHEIDRLFKQTFKQTLNIGKKTPNHIIEKLMKSWSIETMSDLSYSTALHKWIRHK